VTSSAIVFLPWRIIDFSGYRRNRIRAQYPGRPDLQSRFDEAGLPRQ